MTTPDVARTEPRWNGRTDTDSKTQRLRCSTAPTKAPEGDFEDAVASAAFDDLKTFADHCARSRKIMSALPLDHEFPHSNPYTLRWIYLYLGHADLLRERVDGGTEE
jgi:hypothetical protein